MRILWLCNIMLPAFARANDLPYSNREGWLSGSFERIVRRREEETKEDANAIILGVACPVPERLGECRQEIEGVLFYGFREDLVHPEVYDETLEESFRRILKDFKPDIVHIFGTEFPHTLAMTRAFGNPSHTLIGIQGLCCTIAENYMADLPYSVQRGSTFRDIVKKDSLLGQQKKYLKRAETEKESIKAAGHVTGRTGLDRRETNRINPEAKYHPMNETMRSVFYSGQWELDKVEEHSIFISQGDYPLKGLHYMLLAMPRILMSAPDAKLYCAGNSIIGNVGDLYVESGKAPLPLRIPEYGKYLKKLIHDLGLTGHVFMTGPLNAEEMKERFLRSHVFVCPSTVENSPNSLCEAMLLGMPVVAARVGGIPDLVRNGEDGLLFAGGHPEELSEEVVKIFENDDLALSLGKAAHNSAAVRHNADTNFKRLVEIYRSIL